MTNLKVTTPRTVVNGILKMGLIGLVGIGIYSAPSILEARRYSARVGELKAFIENDNQDGIGCKEFLDGAIASKPIKKEDEKILTEIVNSKIKKDRMAVFGRAVADYNYESAKQVYDQLTNEGLDKPTSLQLKDRLNRVLLSNIVSSLANQNGEEKIKTIAIIEARYPRYESMKQLREEKASEELKLAQTLIASTKSGEDKIRTLENFCLTYTNCPLIPQIKKAQAEEYQTTAKVYLETSPDLDKTITFFDKFLDWSSKNKQIMSKESLKTIYIDGRNYLTKKTTEEATKIIAVGDKVEVVKLLGELNGHEKGRSYMGYHSHKIGDKGVIYAEDPSGTHTYKVSFNGAREGEHFILRELKRIDSDNLPKFACQLETLKKLYEAN